MNKKPSRHLPDFETFSQLAAGSATSGGDKEADGADGADGADLIPVYRRLVSDSLAVRGGNRVCRGWGVLGDVLQTTASTSRCESCTDATDATSRQALAHAVLGR